MTRPPRSTTRLVAAAVALVGGIFGSGLMVWSASSAAFSGKTVNPSNSWNAGSVVLTDDDSNSAMFSASGLTPNSAAQVSCIAVTYNGTVTAPVKLYGAAPTGTGLGTYLNLTIEIGTGGAFNNCTGFTPSSTIYATNTLANFASSYTSYSAGLATGWSPTGTGQTKVFRFTTSVQDNNNANGLNCSMPFTWEAQA